VREGGGGRGKRKKGKSYSGKGDDCERKGTQVERARGRKGYSSGEQGSEHLDFRSKKSVNRNQPGEAVA